MSEKKWANINVRVEEKFKRELEELASADNRSLSNLIKMVLDDFIQSGRSR